MATIVNKTTVAMFHILVGYNINFCVLQGSFEAFHCHAELTYECMLVPHDFEIFSKYLLQSAF